MNQGCSSPFSPSWKVWNPLTRAHYHHLNALSHTLLALEKMSWALDWLGSRKPGIPLSEEDHLSLSYAALFHDLGKTKHAFTRGGWKRSLLSP